MLNAAVVLWLSQLAVLQLLVGAAFPAGCQLSYGHTYCAAV
jgi:hypothetical protein